nr:retrovirus-related Pol polyprotein from transposon TNT 1-94 [Tanacetum cinerariifolium]
MIMWLSQECLGLILLRHLGENYVPNKVRASVRKNPITVSQPHVITKKDVNSDSNGLSSIGVDNTAKTRRPQPRSNTKNDRVPSASKSSCIKNKEVKVEEHSRNLLHSKNKKYMSSKCNSVKLAIQNDKSKVVCAMCKQCLITANHDVCVLNYVKDMNSHGYPNLFMVRRLGFLQAYDRESKASHQFRLEVLGTVHFGNDHVAAILGFSDLQWGNILITRRLSHLNFDTINDLAKNDLVIGLPKFKYHKEHPCPSCNQGKIKRASHPPKPVPNFKQRLHLFHTDLCGPMRIASINGKRYVLVIMDDYSRYTWVHFLRSKDKAPKVIKIFLKRITVLLQYPVIIIRTDNDTKFKNQILKEYFDSVGISHQASSIRTPRQNRVVERRNQTLVEAARTMLIFSRALLFLWDEAIATGCYTQNRSINHYRVNKTPYELINGRKPNISFLHVVRALCYPKNDREDIGKLGAKAAPITTLAAQAPPVRQTSTNVKEATTDPAWIKSMQEELFQFKRLDVWVLVPPLDNIKPLTLKWLFKNKHDEESTVIRNKTRLVVRGYPRGSNRFRRILCSGC